MAGMVDSEGSISINHGSIRIRVVNTDMRLHKWLKSEFGGNFTPMKRQTENRKQAWEWSAHGKNAHKVLKRIEDKLLLKSEQAKLCIELYERVSKSDFKGYIPYWAKKLNEENGGKLKKLNKRGIDKTEALRDDSEIKIENKLAYLAGYIDGDGAIMIKKDKRWKPPRYQYHVSIGSTDHRSMEWIKQNFGGKISPCKTRNERHAKQYSCQFSGDDVYKIIKDVRDYILLKQEQADAVIELYERVTKHNLRSRPLWAINVQESLFHKCKALNKRGVSEKEEIEPEIQLDVAQKNLEVWNGIRV